MEAVAEMLADKQITPLLSTAAKQSLQQLSERKKEKV